VIEFEYYRNDELPQELIAKVKKQIVREISDFGVSLIRDQDLAGSGVLVSVGPKTGILTALHVAESAIGHRKTPIGLNIAQHDHQFFVASELIQPIVIGRPPLNKFTDQGPDLCFLAILDVNILSIIRSRKSIYRLDGRSFDKYRELPLEQMPWWVAGSPDEFSKHYGKRGTASHVLGVSHFHAEGTFTSIEERGQFDFVSLDLNAGNHGFPSKYGGVSGGGIWMAPFTMNPDVGKTSIGYEPPFLAGIAFYEGELRDGHRRLTGHGPKSIYDRVAEAVMRS
jgi:hypothetical protein